MRKNKLKCQKCKKIGNEFVHLVLGVDGTAEYYHWECFDKEYNKKIDTILKDVHKDDTYEK